MNDGSNSPIVRPFGLAVLTSFCKVSSFKSSSFAYINITTINVNSVRARCTIRVGTRTMNQNRTQMKTKGF